MKSNLVEENTTFAQLRSTTDLRIGLKTKEKVLYSENGNRSRSSNSFLKAIEKKAKLLGITRVSDISYLSFKKFPVFQSCRPAIWGHVHVGQNSGGQGKGLSRVQAKISCLMETIEGFCGEPTSANLIRGSYQFLSSQHVVAHPGHFLKRFDTPSLTEQEPLIWVPALALSLGQEVLIPAETVFFPFLSEIYRTRPVFPNSTNGLASGSSYLEAVIHGLYEVIERFYTSQIEQGRARLEALFEEDIQLAGMASLASFTDDIYELQLYSVEMDFAKNLPVIVCALVDNEGQSFSGIGCSMTVDISLSRAISEALQAVATFASGTREDLTAPRYREENFTTESDIPSDRTLHINDYRKRVLDRKFQTLNQEFKEILKWLRGIGYNEVFIANLTRSGIDVPVVKIVVPGLDMENYMKSPSSGLDSIERIKFSANEN